MRSVIFALSVLFFGGCSDRGEVFVQDKKILTTHIECMQLSIFPPNKAFETKLRSLYRFSKDCPYELVLSYKTDIVCNSNQNYAKKTSGLPSGYLRLEIKKEGTLQYTYYKDLKDKLTQDEIAKGFESLKKDLDF